MPVGVSCTVTLAPEPELETLIGAKFAKVFIPPPLDTFVPDLVKPPVEPNGDDVTPPVVSPVYRGDVANSVKLGWNPPAKLLSPDQDVLALSMLLGFKIPSTKYRPALMLITMLVNDNCARLIKSRSPSSPIMLLLTLGASLMQNTVCLDPAVVGKP